MKRLCNPPKTVIAAAALGLPVVAAGFCASALADAKSAESAALSPSTFLYGTYAIALRTYVNGEGMVDYEALEADRDELDDFNQALGDLENSEFDAWSRDAKMAFWINAYNSLTLGSIIDNYPIAVSFFNPKRLLYPENSIRQIGGVWDETKHKILGERVTLDHIEHEILRKEFNEPRIHMALVCAAMGCPPLRNEPYTGEKLNAQLDDQARKFLANRTKLLIDRDADKVHLSPIFKWFGEDFVKIYKPDEGFPGHSETERAVLNFVSRFISGEDARFLKESKYNIEYLDYDWSLNEQS